jgi:hypothetical protein
MDGKVYLGEKLHVGYFITTEQKSSILLQACLRPYEESIHELLL